MQDYIVLQDPEYQFYEGDLINEQWYRKMSNRDCTAAIKVNKEVLARHAIAGYFRRAFGKGVKLSDCTPDRLCPVSLFLVKSAVAKHIHWAARLVPDESYAGDRGGSLRLIADSSSSIYNTAGLSPSQENAVDLSKLGEPDSTGGWSVQGYAPVSTAGDGPVSFVLWGAGRGFKVQWVAVSQA